MISMQRLCVLGILCMLSVVHLRAAEEAAPVQELTVLDGVSVVRNIPYAKAGGKQLLMDLYLPKTKEAPVPVLLWVFGGGWISGNRVDGCPALGFVPYGYAVASIDYRLLPDHIYPAQIEDCKAAVRWLRANAKTYRLDADHIGAVGPSAGGHLVALLGTTSDVKALEGTGGNPQYSSRVQAVVDYFGPTDFMQTDPSGKTSVSDAGRKLTEQLVGGPFAEHMDVVRLTNPINFITQDDAPFFIIHGDQDTVVPLAQSELLHAKLQEAGVESTLFIAKGEKHGIQSPEISAQISKAIIDFLQKHLKPAPVKQGGE